MQIASPPPTFPLVRCGPSGWAHKHWQGVVYPSGTGTDFSPLEFLAARFDTLEITSSFTHMVKPEVALNWTHHVSGNRDFRFTARVNRQFTHERNLDAAALRAFRDGLALLAERNRLGCLVMQFPASFKFTRENREFFIQLRRALHDFPLAAEFRHRSWNLEEAVGTLIDYHVSFANIDHPAAVWATPPTSRLTWRVGYVKLHGQRVGPGHEQFDDRGAAASGNDYLYNVEQLAEWRKRIDAVARFAESTYVVFNNDGAGHSVVNALQMQSLLATPVATPASKPRTAAAPLLAPSRAA
ncbi:MAG: DUF72 domain-containing protein [Acidobacteria bacterium]|nr:DUF72 domain-containing protein [Acidobacteriota bacterium]